MDLQTAAKRYEEGRRFWAREIAVRITSTGGRSRSIRILLRGLMVNDSPMSSKALSTTIPAGSKGGTGLSHVRNTVDILSELTRGGMVRRSGNHKHHLYALTELGALVCLYLPVDAYPAEGKNTAVDAYPAEGKKRGRPRKSLVATQSD